MKSADPALSRDLEPDQSVRAQGWSLQGLTGTDPQAQTGGFRTDGRSGEKQIIFNININCVRDVRCQHVKKNTKSASLKYLNMSAVVGINVVCFYNMFITANSKLISKLLSFMKVSDFNCDIFEFM